MVVLDNIDFKNLKLNKFKPFTCLCELCDCGCFERSKQAHHPECTNKPGTKLRPATSSIKCPLSHYKDTFRANPNARPASTYQPPPDLFVYLPKGPIDLNTIQKTEFKPYPYQPRVKPFKLVDNYQVSNEPISGISSYKADFPHNDNVSFATKVKKNPNETSIRKPAEGMQTKSTTKEHFKGIVQPVAKGFHEHPSYVGEHLFPTTERNFQTMTNSVHDKKELPKKSNLPKSEIKGNLTSEGDMDLGTNYRETFVKYSDIEPAKKILPNQNEIMISSNKMMMPSITQTHYDFSYKPSRPPKAADCNPYLSNLDQLIYPGSSYDHITNYSRDFTTIDMDKFEKAKLCKAPIKAYEIPSEKVQGETVTMRDFKPIDVTQVPVLKAIKLTSKLKIPAGPMETQTVTRTHFPPYEVKPVVFAKDLHPDYYIPPISKFMGETTTKETFQGKQVPRRVLCKPDVENIVLSGAMDLNTSYKDEFKNHGLSMCEAKAYLIAKAMEEREKQTLSNSLQRSKTVSTLTN